MTNKTTHHVKPAALLRSLLMLLLLMAGGSRAFGQDYSGTYYIANNNYHDNTFDYKGEGDANNYYLCPANEYYDDGAMSTVDNGMPFLTTFKTQQDANSVWVVEKVEGTNYYTFKHKQSGRYLTVNDALTGYKPHRRRIHLESVSVFSNRNYFTIERVVGKTQGGVFAYTIGCLDDYKNGSNQFLNPAGGNKDYYVSINNNEEPKSGGIVGFFTKGTTANDRQGSVWYFEVPKPVITHYDGSTGGTISISSISDNVVIRYTVDSSDPTSTSTAYTSPFIPENGTTVVKARAFAKNNDGVSATASFDIPLLPSPTITYDNATKTLAIRCSRSGSTIYYTTDESTPTTATTTNGTTPVIISDMDSPTTFKAFAVKSGWLPSEVAQKTINKVATPTTDITSDGKVKIVTSTLNATIYYTLDGSTPTISSTRFVSPLADVNGKVIKAIAVKDGWITSDVGGSDGEVTLKCAAPVIKRGVDNTFTITCSFPAEELASIYYTTNGNNPTTADSKYTGPVSITSFPVTVKAVVVASGFDNSNVAELTINEGLGQDAEGYYEISSVGEFELLVNMVNNGGAGNKYRLTGDFSASGVTTPVSAAFSGTFDGAYHTISDLDNPLFNSINGGTVKNVLLSDVDISGGTNAGAICSEADGATKIYNCGVLGGSVSGSANVGGLVGLISSGSSVRVVNCYNYATISGGSTMAGIVGKNEGTVGDVRIALCMMYGNMPSGTSPVYAGNHTSNASNFTEYNFWRSKANLTYTAYNDQLAIDKDDYLTRFPFYRHILNTHRELAAFFLFGETGGKVSDISNDEIAEIGHWALKKDVAAYPIIEQWETHTKKVTIDIDTNLPATTDENVGRLLNEMGTAGYLTVNVSINGSTFASQLPITDMNESEHDYTWGKVVLPFANEYDGWSAPTDESNNYICTGWKITSVTNGTAGTFENYNVSDRDCTTKDLYSTTGFIFAQGGNYVVPYGVTAINIEANFAKAYYLSDASYEIGYSGDGSGSGYKDRTALGGSMPDTYQGRTVYHTLAAALGAMSASGSTHEQAVVLVGNYHQDNEALSSHTSKGLTIMSIDADNNQEPDYAWYSNNTQDRPKIPPTRFDFVALVPVGMSSRVNNSTFYPLIPIWKPYGWFEMTETSLSMMDQFELDSGNFNTSSDDTRNYRCIINSGYFTQMVRARNTDCSNVQYYQIGGNAYIKEFYPGSHSSVNKTTTIVPINVTGGEIEQCFMTGYGKGKATGSDIYFWCAGGKIHKFLGAYMENPSTDGVNMTAKIDHAQIGRFFGGGTSPKARITGNIDVTINNSHVDFYCGGPEFGDMTAGKTVTTHATGTTFGEFYGAGFGGTAITYTNDEDDSTQGLGDADHPTVSYPSDFFTNHYLDSKTDVGRLDYKSGYGIGNSYKFEFIFMSRGNGSVARFYTGYASFSLAMTGSVTNDLNGCTITNDFYGAGCQGKVNGTVTSTLTGCTVNGSAYGGGFKAESNEVEVYPETAPTMSVYNREMGVFSDFGTVTSEIYTWEQGTSAKKNTVDGKKLYTGTDVTMSDLGNVTGAISLTIDGGTIGKANDATTGNVFGGGNESKSLNSTTVTIKNGAQVNGDVYGGGALANTGGTTINLVGGTIAGNVYGGGKGQIGREAEPATAAVGEEGTPDYVPAKPAVTAITAVAALVDGDVLVELNKNVADDEKGCVVNGNIFGCNNQNGSPLGHVKVHIFKTQNAGKAKITDKALGDFDVAAVYGGGNLSAYTPTKATNESTTDDADAYSEVIIDGCSRTSIRQVYGGGNAASTPGTKVDVFGTFEIDEVFGGGNGNDSIIVHNVKKANPGANVGFYEYVDNTETSNTKQKRVDNYGYGSGKAQVNIYGGRINAVYGGSNTKGNVREIAIAMLEEQTTDGIAICTMRVTEAYGGGKSAPMDGRAVLQLGCIPGINEIYGGAKNADVNNDVELTIINGTYGKVFGGNNVGGVINGTITVNVEETGCTAVNIGELYGGGNLAPYSVENIPTGKANLNYTDATSANYYRNFPKVNVKSASSIGKVFGGGFGESAEVTGNPQVSINMIEGAFASNHRLGTIGEVYGGGNQARVVGNTNVEIGTKSTVSYVSGSDHSDKTVRGATITGNVYGGGNQAEVTGNTNVTVGQQK